MLQPQFEKNLAGLPSLEARELALYERHYEILKEWNAKIALVSRKTFETSVFQHYADSIHIAQFAKKFERGPVHDLGTGAGFPGLIYAIRYPGTSVTLYEKLEKKRKYLADAIERLELKNVRLQGALLAGPIKGLLLARAVMPPPELIAFLTPKMVSGSRFILNLGSTAPQPSTSSAWKLLEGYSYVLPGDAGTRTAISFERST